MGDFKSKLPDFKELSSFAGKLFRDVKTSVGEIIDEYKKKRAEEEKAAAAAAAAQPKEAPPKAPEAPPQAQATEPPPVQPQVQTPVEEASAKAKKTKPAEETVKKDENSDSGQA